jgi:hypothetical protein
MLFFIWTGKSFADSWGLPKTEKYFSANKKYRFVVIPKQLESQLKYFKDKVEGIANAGAVRGTLETNSKGIFSRRNAWGLYKNIRTFPLMNEVSPVEVFLSNDGEYIVTFDDWHGTGYGDNVIVIYRSDGTLVKRFALLDLLTEGDLESLPRSVSSIWWGGHHYIDELRDELVVLVVSNRTMPYEKHATFSELRIRLASGMTLEPKKDRLLQLHFTVDIGPDKGNRKSEIFQDSQNCSVPGSTWNSAESNFIASTQLFEKAKEITTPQYPTIGRQARVHGAVIVEMLILPSGQVLCTRAIAGPPLLRKSAVEEALKWKFRSAVAGDEKQFIGTLEVNYKMYESIGSETGSIRK